MYFIVNCDAFCHHFNKVLRMYVCIIGDAILHQTGKNGQKSGPEFGGLLWRHLTPQRKTAIQVHNYNSSRAYLPQ